MKKIVQLIFLMLCIAQLTNAQQFFPAEGIYNHTVNYPEYKAIFHVRTKEPRTKSLHDFKKYFWYSANQINATQGAYSGRLLDGFYQEIYNNKNLRRQGNFDQGLMTGNWKYWGIDGRLDSVMHYKRGAANGAYLSFDSLGNPALMGQYRSGQKNGRWVKYLPGDRVELSRYRKGRIIETKPSKLKTWMSRMMDKIRKKPVAGKNK